MPNPFGHDLLAPFRFYYAAMMPWSAMAVVIALFEGAGVVAAAEVIRAQGAPLAVLAAGASCQLVLWAMQFLFSIMMFNGTVPGMPGGWLLAGLVACTAVASAVWTVLTG